MKIEYVQFKKRSFWDYVKEILNKISRLILNKK
jgi:hypothetical protein